MTAPTSGGMSTAAGQSWNPDRYARNARFVSDLGMEALKNPRLIQAAREAAQLTVAADPTLAADTPQFFQ